MNVQNEDGESTSSNRAPSYETFTQSFVCPLALEMPTRVLECAYQIQSTMRTPAIPSTPKKSKAGMTVNSSPFPDIDDAFLKALRNQGMQLPDAYIASSVYYQDSQSLVYTIGGSRFFKEG